MGHADDVTGKRFPPVPWHGCSSATCRRDSNIESETAKSGRQFSYSPNVWIQRFYVCSETRRRTTTAQLKFLLNLNTSLQIPIQMSVAVGFTALAGVVTVKASAGYTPPPPRAEPSRRVPITFFMHSCTHRKYHPHDDAILNQFLGNFSLVNIINLHHIFVFSSCLSNHRSSCHSQREVGPSPRVFCPIFCLGIAAPPPPQCFFPL